MAAFQHDDSKTMTLSETEVRLKSGSRILCESPYIYDHFTYGAGALNSHVPQYWVTTETGGAGTAFAPSATEVGGKIVGVTGTTTNTHAEEVAGKGLFWQPSTQALKGPLVFECRIAHASTTPANGDLGVGFSDAVTDGAAYIVSAASALTTHAPSDYAGFWYTSIATSGSLFVTGGNPYGIITTIADVDTVTAPNTTNRVIKAGLTTFVKLRVELDSAGNAKFFANDKWQASVPLAVTAATKFTPHVVAICKANEAQTVHIDYMFVGGDLV